MQGTLAFELRKLQESNKNKEYYENLVLFFDSYYGGKAIDKKDYEILDTNINYILRDSSEFIINIVKGVKSYPNNKSKLSERLEVFLDHLKNKYRSLIYPIFSALNSAETSHGNIYNTIKLENYEETIILDIDSVMNIDRVDKEEYLKS